MRTHAVPVAIVLLTAGAAAWAQSSAGTAFTYQGQLKLNGVSLNDPADFVFKLYGAASGGNQIGPSQTLPGVPLARGLFTVKLDFGAAAFPGDARWLDIQVRHPAGGGAYQQLTPRQELTPATYALGLNLPFSGTTASPSTPAFQVSNTTAAGIMGISQNGTGVVGQSTTENGVYGGSAATGWAGVIGVNTSTGDGVWGASAHAKAVHGTTTDGWAGYFEGRGYFSGNVGIGTTSPGFPLSFASQDGDKIGFYGQSGNHYGFGVQPYLLQIMTDAPGADVGFGWGQSSAFTETARLTGTGNLRVQGGIAVDRRDRNTGILDPNFALTFGAGATGEGIGSKRTAGGSQNGLDFYTAANSRMTITNSGNVGIGTSAPRDRLHVAGGYWGKGHFMLYANEGEGQNGTAYIQARDASGTSSIGLQFRTQRFGSYVDAMKLDAGGDLLIPAGSLRVVAEAGQDGPTIYGESTYQGAALWGRSNGSALIENAGVYGESLYNSGNGVAGIANNGENAYAIYGESINGYAGYFQGEVHSFGLLDGPDLHVKIDHPVDPATRYLSHSTVQSAEQKTVYDGTVTTDARGYATVMLPDWFEALNRDFRYQLTIVDDSDSEHFIQAKVVRRIADHQFTIRTSMGNVAVCWQVTGIRQDAYALAHPVTVDELKPESERGYYLHPVEHGQSEQMSINWQRKRRGSEHAAHPAGQQPVAAALPDAPGQTNGVQP